MAEGEEAEEVGAAFNALLLEFITEEQAEQSQVAFFEIILGSLTEEQAAQIEEAEAALEAVFEEFFSPLVFGPQGPTELNLNLFLPAGPSEHDGTQFLNSGSNLELPYSYELTFTEPGTFFYVCAFHEGMFGLVTVTPPEEPVEVTQQGWDALAAEELDAFLEQVDGLQAAREIIDRPDGTREYVMEAGISGEGVDINTFHRDSITVRPRDTVTWTWEKSHEIHSVTFTSGAEPPPLGIPELAEDGSISRLPINPEAWFPAGGSTYSGTGYFSSGITFFGGEEIGFPPGRYSLTFTTPGDYDYLSLAPGRPESVGTIKVRDSVLPLVGDAAPSPLIIILAGVAAVGFIIAGGGLLFMRRRARA